MNIDNNSKSNFNVVHDKKLAYNGIGFNDKFNNRGFSRKNNI